jgi:metal-responsive CopG/Arc/MetJ family transcriptional regulator
VESNGGGLVNNGDMRVKKSVTLSRELLTRIDRVATNRAAFIEKASRVYLESIERARRDARDLEILNANADRSNAEAADALEYQAQL